MKESPRCGKSSRLSTFVGLSVICLLLTLHLVAAEPNTPLPKRLVLGVDGISYRDLKALQTGLTYKDRKGHQHYRQAFNEGYFPVSRMVSTFPSASDVAWTEMLRNEPLPGYQRTYYSSAENAEFFDNGVTSTMEYEHQMEWQVQSGFLRAIAYVYPDQCYSFELHELVRHFLKATGTGENYYAYLRCTDDAQHMGGDILAMLCRLDQTLRELRATYRAREGRDLEILILSDHGNNHAGAGTRVEVLSYLKKAGYHVRQTISGAKDVVLPTAGIESWVEIHNTPSETETLLSTLTNLPGVDVLSGIVPEHTNRFLVMNWKGERANIEWNPLKDAYRYSAQVGDPLGYLPVVASLSSKKCLDSEGFATADDWMSETLERDYPLALERIVRAHTFVTLNPATVLISLKNNYVHASWLIKKGSELVTSGGTHGGLDALNSDGIVLSSFTPTQDTSANRLAALFQGFKGRRDFRAGESGAQWVWAKAPQLMASTQTPNASGQTLLPREQICLRVWNPAFTHLDREISIDVTLTRYRRFLEPDIRRGEELPKEKPDQLFVLNLPFSTPDSPPYLRVYAFPSHLILQPKLQYRLAGHLNVDGKTLRLFDFNFHTDGNGIPVTY